MNAPKGVLREPGPKLAKVLADLDQANARAEMLKKWAACVQVEELFGEDGEFESLEVYEDWEAMGDGFASRRKILKARWRSAAGERSLTAITSRGSAQWAPGPNEEWNSELLQKAQARMHEAKEALWVWFDLVKGRKYGEGAHAHMQLAQALLGKDKARELWAMTESELIRLGCREPRLDGGKPDQKRL